ncbi:hypothetical protein ABID29_002150 [Streptococcus rupicaprae]|uniref:J domain-containing protein n=1 Tax=Streptococcus rupicaprae TaxID=759619 RepID=A0ABV2FKB5_9STRE
MNQLFWEILEMAPTDDIRVLRRQYASLVRRYHPEDFPVEYQRIKEAYETALTYLRQGEVVQATQGTFSAPSLTDLSQDQQKAEEVFSEEADSPSVMAERFDSVLALPQDQRGTEEVLSEEAALPSVMAERFDSILHSFNQEDILVRFERFLEQRSLDDREWDLFFQAIEGEEALLKSYLEKKDVTWLPSLGYSHRLLWLIEQFMPEWQTSRYVERLEAWVRYLRKAMEESIPRDVEDFEAFYNYCRTLKRTLEKSEMLNHIGPWEYLLTPSNRRLTGTTLEELASEISLRLNQIENPELLRFLQRRFEGEAFIEWRKNLSDRYKVVAHDSFGQGALELGVGLAGVLAILLGAYSLYQTLMINTPLALLMGIVGLFCLSYTLSYYQAKQQNALLSPFAKSLNLIFPIVLLILFGGGQSSWQWGLVVATVIGGLYTLWKDLLPQISYRLVAKEVRVTLILLLALYNLASWAAWFLVGEGIEIAFIMGLLVIPFYLFNLMALAIFRRRPIFLTLTFYKKNFPYILVAGVTLFLFWLWFRSDSVTLSLLIGLNEAGLGNFSLILLFNFLILPYLTEGRIPLADYACQFLALVQVLIALLIVIQLIKPELMLETWPRVQFLNGEILFLISAFVSAIVIVPDKHSN